MHGKDDFRGDAGDFFATGNARLRPTQAAAVEGAGELELVHAFQTPRLVSFSYILSAYASTRCQRLLWTSDIG